MIDRCIVIASLSILFSLYGVLAIRQEIPEVVEPDKIIEPIQFERILTLSPKVKKAKEQIIEEDHLKLINERCGLDGVKFREIVRDCPTADALPLKKGE